MDWFVTVLKRYAVFSGRAGRAEFWYFTLIYFVAALVLSLIDGILGTVSARAGMGLLSGVFALALLVPAVAVTVRRLHDSDLSGWWCLVGLVPLFGAIVLLVLMLRNSTAGANRFGSAPEPAL